MPIDTVGPDSAARRLFLKQMTLAGLGVAAASLLNGSLIPLPSADALTVGTDKNVTVSDAKKAFPGIPGNSVVEIVLNYALTLEILEADLYRQALNKAADLPLSTPLKSSPSKYKLGVKKGGDITQDRADVGFEYIAEFAFVEAAHRDFLIAAIKAAGGNPTKPNPGGYAFPDFNRHPTAGISYILGQILPLEETGVRAYLGALPYLGDSLSYAQVAGGIYSTEARHSAAIRYILGFDPGPVPMPTDMRVVSNYPSPNTFEYYLTPQQVLTAASVYFA